jgi:hypothetical protein
MVQLADQGAQAALATDPGFLGGLSVRAGLPGEDGQPA